MVVRSHAVRRHRRWAGFSVSTWLSLNGSLAPALSALDRRPRSTPPAPRRPTSIR
ncbi:hypothetical protein ACE0DR_17020 [Azotobacter sp. CWF10]